MNGLCRHHLPLWRDWGAEAGGDQLWQVALRATRPSPSTSLLAKNSLSHYHARDTEHHTHEHIPARGPPGVWSCAEGWGPGAPRGMAPGGLHNWAGTWLDCGAVCKCAGPCVEGLGGTVMSWVTEIQKTPGKPGPHLPLQDPPVSLSQPPAGPQWPQRKEGGRPQDLRGTLW